MFASLAVDAGRRDGATRSIFSDGLKAFVAQLMQLMPGRTASGRRAAALANVATMIGALAMARSMDDEDFSDEILKAARAAIIAKKTAAKG